MESRVPKFTRLVARSAVASRIAASIKGTNTSPEIALKRELRKARVSFTREPRGLPGKPDFILLSWRAVIFCDGDFWHGRHWAERKKRLQGVNNAPYWISKIGYNRERDRRVNRSLTRAGWLVIRFWASDLLEDPASAAALIKRFSIVSGAILELNSRHRVGKLARVYSPTKSAMQRFQKSFKRTGSSRPSNRVRS